VMLGHRPSQGPEYRINQKSLPVRSQGAFQPSGRITSALKSSSSLPSARRAPQLSAGGQAIRDAPATPTVRRAGKLLKFLRTRFDRHPRHCPAKQSRALGSRAAGTPRKRVLPRHEAEQVLVPAYVRLDVPRRDESHIMVEIAQLKRPMMRAGAGLQPDEAGRAKSAIT
jgi:hypothetical protein